MDIQGDMQITLVIKAPNQRMEDQTVDCMLGWTIRKLKHHLESVYPSKPKHHEQRLIYSGKLLQDHLTLKEVLKHYDSESDSNTHTVHLVCSNSASSPNVPSTSSKSPKPKEQSSPSAVSNPLPSEVPSSSDTSSPTSSARSDIPGTNTDGLRHRVHQGHHPSQNAFVPSSFQSFPGQQFSPWTPPTAPPAAYAAYTPEQYNWMVQQQQAAYTQYMVQYMQYYQQSLYGGAGQPFAGGAMMPPTVNPFTIPPAASVASSPGQQQHPQDQPQQPVQQPQQQPQPPANQNEARGNNNVQMNAQGGIEEEDDDERDPRDWLHHTYFIMRFITFVGIIVFYSSFSRFVMVMAGFLIIYFLQRLRVTRQQQMRRQQQLEQQQREEEARQQQQQQQEQEQQEEQHQEQVGDNVTPVPQQSPPDASEDQNTETSDEPSSATTPEQTDVQAAQEERNKLIRSLFFIWRTVESFFSSLVPVPPELLEGN